MSGPGGSGARGWRRLAAGAVAAGSTRLVYQRALRRQSADRWERSNHRGEPVTLLEGPAVAAGAAAGLLVAPGLSRRVRGAGILAVVVAGGLGAYDDVKGSSEAKGLKGHLGAMARGELTTGGAKVLGIGSAGLVSGALARRGRGGAVDGLLAGVAVAGLANLVNLLDLRPGRATKVVLAAAAPAVLRPGPAGDLLAGPVGAAAALLPDDLAERAMLGDSGANALGAALGVAAAASMSRSALAATCGGVVALTLASERVSFTRVIEQTPGLRELDRLGRRPVA